MNRSAVRDRAPALRGEVRLGERREDAGAREGRNEREGGREKGERRECDERPRGHKVGQKDALRPRPRSARPGSTRHVLTSSLSSPPLPPRRHQRDAAQLHIGHTSGLEERALRGCVQPGLPLPPRPRARADSRLRRFSTAAAAHSAPALATACRSCCSRCAQLGRAPCACPRLGDASPHPRPPSVAPSGPYPACFDTRATRAPRRATQDPQVRALVRVETLLLAPASLEHQLTDLRAPLQRSTAPVATLSRCQTPLVLVRSNCAAMCHPSTQACLSLSYLAPRRPPAAPRGPSSCAFLTRPDSHDTRP